eukprot:1886229-Rhodomonas_salina.3
MSVPGLSTKQRSPMRMRSTASSLSTVALSVTSFLSGTMPHLSTLPSVPVLASSIRQFSTVMAIEVPDIA